MKKTTFITILFFVFSGSVNAAVLDVESLTITSGDFAMGAPGVGACDNDDASFGSFKCLVGGTSTPFMMGAYQGDANDAGTITDFNFFGQPVHTFTAASAAGAATNPTGLPNGTVDTVAGTMTLDLGGFYAHWGTTNFLQGTDPSGANGTSTVATGTYDAGTGAFDISWQSYITTDPFAGSTGFWHLTGTAAVSAVPVPAAIWLFGSGLLGLLGWARRK